jgi:hypothetical protein
MEKQRWKDSMRLLNSSRQLWIVEEDEPFSLYKVEVQSKDKYDIIIDAKNRDYYGITAEEAERCRALALPASSGGRN